ncbi:metal-dependent hydrolase [Pectinatus sottacetonis]|uniref:metal-dependent hydrolase n=1 Tax=Pectinatus sottacetonis TaxID=1002795 RepID=UPI0018C84457|nr:metal-dependent hydrolase [Pectinatus sottacetonis]
MTWKSHKVLTTAAVFALTNNILFALIAGLGSIFPDKIEYIIFSRDEWQARHRTISHWFVIYAAIDFLLYMTLTVYGFFIKNMADLKNMAEITSLEKFVVIVLANFIFWYVIGCIFHILEDALCGKIPVLLPNKQIEFMHLFYVGSRKEYLICYGVAIGIFLLKWKDIIPALKTWIKM